jgi:serine protease Do
MIQGFGEVAEGLRRATVEVETGSGVIWDASGIIVTNAHVARGRSARVKLWDGRSFDAAVLARDPRRDLASLRIAAGDLPATTAGDSAKLRVGELVMAVGNPLGFIGALSTGVVHALSRRWVHADVRLAPGNSGGPLADALGRVIGINTMIANGVALAVPSNSVTRFLRDGSEGIGLGVVVRPVADGILVLEVEPGSPADRSSLMIGDLLVSANGRKFRSLDDLGEAIQSAAGGVLRLEFLRGDRSVRRAASVHLQARAAEAA